MEHANDHCVHVRMRMGLGWRAYFFVNNMYFPTVQLLAVNNITTLKVILVTDVLIIQEYLFITEIV